MRKTLSLAGVILLFSLIQGCGITGENLYLNNSYQYSNERPAKLVILPIGGPDAALTDAAFEKAFEPQKQTVVPLASTRARISGDNALASALTRVVQEEHSRIGSDQSPSLKSLLAGLDLFQLRERSESSDVMLMPMELDFREVMGYTYGHFKYRLYDLKTGTLILENSRDLGVNIVGDKARFLLAHALINYSHSDYEKHFMKLKR